MKSKVTKTLLLTAISLVGLTNLSTAQDANLNLGNLSSYYDKYDNNTKMITGYTYCVTSKNIKCIKIGFWTGSVNKLISRYKTYLKCGCLMFRN